MAKNTNKISIIVLISLLLLLQWKAYAMQNPQSDIEVYTEYTYYAPPSVGENEAKAIALNRAKLSAIEKYFGSVVQQNNATTVIANGYDSNVNFTSFSESEIKGEWVETIGTPHYDIKYDGGLVVTVKLKGIIRPINSAKTDLDIKILCNGTTDKFERTDFHNGDDLFVSITSPVDGFIASYLSDGETVYCLLPYPADDGHASPIKGSVKRILFSYNHNDTNESVKQYHMTCSNGVEINMLYILFSTNNFDKAADTDTDRLLPRQLPFDRFQKWLSSNKRKDRNFQVREYTLTITQ